MVGVISTLSSTVLLDGRAMLVHFTIKLLNLIRGCLTAPNETGLVIANLFGGPALMQLTGNAGGCQLLTSGRAAAHPPPGLRAPEEARGL
jgi:hypothetical protein